jgi:AbrB family looped-hinge helix DNA binding protein
MKIETPIRGQSVVSTRGQTVIPKEIREALGLKEGQKLAWVLREGNLRLIPIPEDPVRALRGILKDSKYTFDDFMRERNEERAYERMLEEREAKGWRDTSSTPQP